MHARAGSTCRLHSSFSILAAPLIPYTCPDQTPHPLNRLIPLPAPEPPCQQGTPDRAILACTHPQVVVARSASMRSRQMMHL